MAKTCPRCGQPKNEHKPGHPGDGMKGGKRAICPVVRVMVDGRMQWVPEKELTRTGEKK